MSAGHYIDVSHTEYSMNLQMKTTCYMREVSIKLAYCTRNFLIKMRKYHGAFKV